MAEIITSTQPQLTVAVVNKSITLSDGVQVHYQEAGPAGAPVLLLTHGFLGAVRDWHLTTGPLAALSAADGWPLRVIALDWVGFGNSSKPEVDYTLTYFAEFLKRFCDAMGLERFYLAGHSMGGKINLVFTLLYPQYVQKLVLVGTDGFITDPKWLKFTDQKWFQTLSRLSVRLLSNKFFLKTMADSVYFDHTLHITEQELEAGIRKLKEPDYKATLLNMNRNLPLLSMSKTGFRERLGEINVPVQLFWGLQDGVIRIDHAHEAQEEIPGAQLYVFDRCGHIPQIEKAPEFNRRLLDFLKK